MAMAIVAFLTGVVYLGLVSSLRAQQMVRLQIAASCRMLQISHAWANVDHTYEGYMFEAPELAALGTEFEHDLERRLFLNAFRGNKNEVTPHYRGWAGVSVVPPAIVSRLDSDNDEIRQVLAQGGQLYYFRPDLAGLNFNDDRGSNTDQMNGENNLGGESAKLIFAIRGAPQQNALRNHPANDWPTHEYYPCPPQPWHRRTWAWNLDHRSPMQLASPVNGVVRITVTNGGSGYAMPPDVTISMGTRRARARAIVNLGQVTAVEVIDPGHGYGSAPAVAFSGGGGSGAAATSTIGPVAMSLVDYAAADATAGQTRWRSRYTTVPDWDAADRAFNQLYDYCYHFRKPGVRIAYGYVGEDRNGNGAMDAGEDRDGNGVLDDWGALAAGDVDRDGNVDAAEDANGNAKLDWGEDANGNRKLDPVEAHARQREWFHLGDEDANGNGVLDAGEDSNGNGVLDFGRGHAFPLPTTIRITDLRTWVDAPHLKITEKEDKDSDGILDNGEDRADSPFNSTPGIKNGILDPPWAGTRKAGDDWRDPVNRFSHAGYWLSQILTGSTPYDSQPQSAYQWAVRLDTMNYDNPHQEDLATGAGARCRTFLVLAQELVRRVMAADYPGATEMTYTTVDYEHPGNPWPMPTMPKALGSPPWASTSEQAFPPPFKILALSYLAYAAHYATKVQAPASLPNRNWNPSTTAGWTVASAQAEVRKVRRYAQDLHAVCLAWTMRYSSSDPYDWGAPRPLNRITAWDFPLLQYDLLPSGKHRPTTGERARLPWNSSSEAANAINSGDLDLFGLTAATSLFDRSSSLAARWSVEQQRPAARRGLKWTTAAPTPGSEADLDLDRCWKVIAPRQPQNWGPAWGMRGYEGGGRISQMWQPPGSPGGDPTAAGGTVAPDFDNTANLWYSWGDHARYNLAAPFAASERCREIVFWAVDWQAFDDFELASDPDFDARSFADASDRWLQSRIDGGQNHDPQLRIGDSAGPLIDSIPNGGGAAYVRPGPIDRNGSKRRYSAGTAATSDSIVEADRGPLPSTSRLRAVQVSRFLYYDGRLLSNLRR